MSVPAFQDLLLPTLEAIAKGQERPVAIREEVRRRQGLSEDDVAEKLPKSPQSVFVNRIAWCLVYLKQAGMIEKLGHGRYRVTDTGRAVLAKSPVYLQVADLKEIAGFSEWHKRGFQGSLPSRRLNHDSDQEAYHQDYDRTPSERVAGLQEEVDAALDVNLLDKLLTLTPVQFEARVLQVLRAMGYAAAPGATTEHTGRSGDAGFDGVIYQDALGMDVIYVQAKQYGRDRTVNRPDIQAFAGSLEGAGADKGVFITTAQFSAGAVQFAHRIAKRLVLIDGQKLTAYMRIYNIGTRTLHTIEIKDIDQNFFDDDF